MIKDINNIDPRLLEEDDRIVAYLKGKMSSEEEQQFLTELEENPELKEKAIVTARLVKGLKEVGTSQDKDVVGAFLASSEQGVEAIAKQVAETQKTVKITPMRKVSSWLAIAASVVGIMWLGIGYTNYRHTTGLGESYDEAFPASMIVRGADTPTEAEKKLEQLFSDVKENKNIANTIHELSLCWELSTMETFNDYTNYSAEIGWNLAIVYLKNNDKKSAKRVLEKLIAITEEGSAINDKAKELFEEL